MGKNKALAPTLPRIRYMCFDLTHAPVATAASAAATGSVSMSTRPDPEGSGTVEIATRRCPRIRHGGDSHPEMPSSPGSVRLARAHPLTKTQAMEPSRQSWSSYGLPYPLGRWSSGCMLSVAFLIRRVFRPGLCCLALGQVALRMH